ncbi:MAG: ester cyclase [Kofleriaceae bacterium]
MATSSHAQIVRTLYDLLNAGAHDRLGEVIGPSFVAGDGSRGPEAFARVMAKLRESFPDLVYTIDAIVADGDRVAVHWTWRGTNSSPFRAFPATGKRVVNSGLAIFQIEAGKITSATMETDRLGFLISIGVITYDPAYGPPPRTE